MNPGEIEAWREQHEAELEERRLAARAQREAERGERLRANVIDPSSAYTRFEEEQAAQMGITVEGLRSLKEQRRAEMQRVRDRGTPAGGGLYYSPDHEVR